jgi:hypothetical protein
MIGGGVQIEQVTPRIDECATCAGCETKICWDEVYGWLHTDRASGFCQCPRPRPPSWSIGVRVDAAQRATLLLTVSGRPALTPSGRCSPTKTRTTRQDDRQAKDDHVR